MEDMIESDSNDGPRKFVLFGGGRCKTSADLEQMERDYIAFCQTLDGALPVPFYDEDRNLEPPGENAIEVLAELGITPAEYMELVPCQLSDR